MTAPKADHMVIAAGGLAFASNFRDAGGFPSNGVTTIAATGVLAFVLSTTRGTSVEPIAKAFAGLALLVAVFYYVPGLYEKASGKSHPKKGKKSG